MGALSKEELLAPENAAGQLDRLEESIMGLDSMPIRFMEYDSESWKLRDLHIMPGENFKDNRRTGNSDRKILWGG